MVELCSTQNGGLHTNYENIYKFLSLKNLNQRSKSVETRNVEKKYDHRVHLLSPFNEKF